MNILTKAYVSAPNKGNLNFCNSSNLDDTMILEIVDCRMLPQGCAEKFSSDELILYVQNIVMQSFPKANIIISTPAIKTRNDKYTTLEIVIAHYEAVFKTSRWNGCCAYKCAIKSQGKSPSFVDITKSSEKFNLGGLSTAKDVLTAAFNAATKELLDKIIEQLTLNKFF